MSSAAPSQEFLVPDGHTTTDESRMEAARRNEINARRLLRVDELLDAGKSAAEACRIAEEENP